MYILCIYPCVLADSNSNIINRLVILNKNQVFNKFCSESVGVVKLKLD